ncbi:MAG: NAD-dependent epimerase/dehydratase family protein [Lentisphaeria bacterium]|nr:NAD-dependent epimerase/dehydratase family protein [Lentisphaeria bacterium]
MNVLVTGGGGFLGRRIVEMLLEQHHAVRVVGRSRYPDLMALGVDCVQGDLRDSSLALDVCQGMDLVFHVAAKAGVWGGRSEFYEINVKGTANIIRGCLEAKVPNLVYTSTPSVVIGPANIENGDETLPYPKRYLSAYPASKAKAERMVLDANGWEMVPNAATPIPDTPAAGATLVKRLQTCALRPHLIWGPRDPHLLPRIVATARAGRLAIVGGGANKVDVTYIDNAAHAHILAAEELQGEGRCAGKVYFIGDAEPVALWPWLNNLFKHLDMEPIRRKLPYGVVRSIGAFMEFAYRVLPLKGEPPMTRFAAMQLAQSHCFLHDRARRDFGYKPIVDPLTALTRTVAWMRSETPWMAFE